ncbi:hypothetical protein BRADI_4g37946v3 [Brachypodium distachyon]|uniref:TF-B3 domain-containing protein n=1 Tax=Brachypodium distachyon TaxID=15368 RepID=A0A2K2CT08_BRADI|nr:hypothetical protein BRADI_4g37946v3 [Brachypodium distachyon]
MRLIFLCTCKAPVEMSNPCECCKSKVKFMTQMHGNFKDSMVIPEWIVNHFGGKISGTIKLEAPNGQIHDVGVAKEMNRTVLQSGWEAFVDVNQIQENFSLMFRWIGRSCLKVTIFDANGEERISCCAGMKHPTYVEKASTNCADISSNSHDGTAQSSDSDGHCREQGNKPAVESSCDEFSDYSPSESESMESDDLRLSKDYVLSGRCYLTEEQEDEINAFVRKIKPEIPLLVVMMKKTPMLAITKDYARAYFPHKNQSVTLKLPENSKNWRCRFCVRPGGRGHHLYLSKFVHDNLLREGDLCLFQPMTGVKATKFTFMFHLLGRAGKADIDSNHGSFKKKKKFLTDHQETSSKIHYILSGRCQLDKEDEVGIEALIAELQPEIPLLVVRMLKSSVNGPHACLVISKGYATAHFPSESQTITLQLPGGKKKWHPRFYIRRGNSAYVLYGQWIDFARDNRLCKEDLCLLQPIIKGKGRRFTVMVHLLPKARSTSRSKGRDGVLGLNSGGTETSDDSNISGYVLLGSSARLTSAQESIVAEKVKSIQSQAPIYVAAIDKSNYSNSLDFGTKGHADRHLPDGKEKVALCQAGWNKEWRVKMHNKRMLPGGGWREFTIDNRLQDGDLCLFELLKIEGLAMAVHIIRTEQYS